MIVRGVAIMVRFNASATIATMRKNKTLVHHITNWVTINDCAQVTRHWGCLPVMAHAREEVEEMVSLAGALVLNIGTLTPELVDSMLVAARAANRKGIPVVLDAVGAGATRLRTEQAQRLLKEVRIDILKGNAGEIASLAGAKAEVRGVESISVPGDMASLARNMGLQYKNVVAVTGETDIVSDGKSTLETNYGHPMMGQVVGTGCLSASTIGCFATTGKDYLALTTQALGCFGLAGERAALESGGPGNFLANLYNNIRRMTAEGKDIFIEARETPK
jgi:hydroxyethylthiazole kinase